MFKKFGVDGSRPPPAIKKNKKQNNVKVIEGYTVTRRTAERVGIDGKSERPTNKVTHISVSKPGESKEDQPDVSYEEVLEMRIRNKSAKGPHVYDEVNSAAQKLGHHQEQQQQPQLPKAGGQESGEILVNHITHSGTDVQQVGLRSASKSSVVSEDSRKSILKSRPKTTSSSSELNGHGTTTPAVNHSGKRDMSPRVKSATPGVTVTHSAPQGLPGSTSGGRKGKPASASGQSRPPPAKPVLHKTSAATGSSVSGHKRSSGVLNGGDSTEFLHFSQQLCISKEHQRYEGGNKEATGTAVVTKETLANESTNTAAIQSVSEHNKPVKDVKFKEELTEIISDDIVQTKPIQPVEEDTSQHHHYAFNIPTAETEHDAMSSPHRLDTPQDIARHSAGDGES